MNRKNNRIAALAFLVAAFVFIVILVGGCTMGTVPVGWSGGTVADNRLYVGSHEGRLVSINLEDGSIRRAEPLRMPSQGGLLSCSSLGCGGGTTTVPIYGTPVVSGELVYIAGYNGKIVAYKTVDFAQRWVYPREGYLEPFVGGLVIYENKLYIGCSDGKVYALDAATGDLLNEFLTDNDGDKQKIWSTPAVDAATGTLFVGSYDKKMYALSLDDLSLKWSFATEGSIISSPLVNDGIVYFGSFDRNLYALNTADGTLIWQFAGKNWFWAQPIILNGLLYAACLDNYVYVLDPITGSTVREAYDLQKPVSSTPAVVDSLVVFATREGAVYKIDSVSGQMTQVIELELDVNGPLTAFEEIVYIHTEAGNLVRINPVTGALLPDISLGD